MNRLYFLLIMLGVLIPFQSKSQNTTQHSYWATYLFNKRLSPHLGLTFDTQLRSADNLEYLRNILIRPGFTYFFNNSRSVTLGYSYILTFPNPSLENVKTQFENTIWEQFLLNFKIRNVSVNNRLRTEQRFLKLNSGSIFSQRLRFQIRAIIPLKELKNNKFSEGWYNGIQNEILLNTQNKESLNNHLLDQNRTGISLGYRFKPELDIEGGFENNLIKTKSNFNTNYVVQVSIFTRFK